MKFSLIAGFDEVGRGPLAGPVVAAAVILDPARPIAGLADSKKLSARQREKLGPQIYAQALAHAVVFVDVAEIDELNILQASLLAMRRAHQQLNPQPDLALVDGNQCPGLGIPTRTIIGGDSSEPAISAASIIAKLARDQYMCELDAAFPGFGFAQHKGYGTRQHLEALRRLGACPHHRRSFAPVRACLPHEELAI